MSSAISPAGGTRTVANQVCGAADSGFGDMIRVKLMPSVLQSMSRMLATSASMSRPSTLIVIRSPGFSPNASATSL